MVRRRRFPPDRNAAAGAGATPTGRKEEPSGAEGGREGAEVPQGKTPSRGPRRLRVVLLFAVACSLAACAGPPRRTIRNPDLDHWDDRRGRYVNLFPPAYSRNCRATEFDEVDFLAPSERKARTYRLVHDPEGDIDRTLGYDPSAFTAAPDLPILRDPVHDIQVTWILHSTFFIQLGDRYRILVDPVLEPIDGAAGFFMPFFDAFELQAEPPVRIEDLGLAEEGEEPRNIVAVSHDHFDHLNWNTLRKMPPDTRFYVPIGLETDFPARFTRVTGMDWYTRDTLGELRITFLPANHRSGRSADEGMNDRSLWGGWLFEWKGRRIYFAGDTGYSAVFEDIRERVGDMDLCLMPISAWFQRQWHLAPEDAIRAARDLGCRSFVPWGYGTWIMSYEHILEPERRLRYAWDKIRPPGMELRILKMGETLSIDLAP